MNNILKYIPGFRSNTKWKKIISAIYYFLVLLIFVANQAFGLFMFSCPFLILNFIDLFRFKKKGIPVYKVLVPLVLSFVLAIKAISMEEPSERSRQEQEVGFESQESLVAQESDSEEQGLKEEGEKLEQETEPEDEARLEGERKIEEEEKKTKEEEEQR